MSGGGLKFRRAIDAVNLAVVFGILLVGTHVAPGLRGAASMLSSLGLLLLGGTLLAKLLEPLRVPHLTGYLVAGLLAGPHALHLIGEVTVRQLAPVNTLALALIALAGGAELRIDQLRRGLVSLLVATGLQNLFVLAGLVLVFVLARDLVPFTQGLPLASVVAIALLWAVIATTRSPSATLAVLSQTHARGPLTSFSLAFIMLSDVVGIVLVAMAITVARALLDPSGGFSLEPFRALGHEMLGSVAIGTSLGLLLAAYIRLVGGQLLVVLVALGFGATEVLHYLHFEPLLTFLVAGFVVQNLSRQGDRFLHAIEGTGAVVYVVFFAIAGVELDIPLLRELWALALLLAAARFAMTYLAGRASSALARDPPILRRWGWAALVAQAGLTQGLAALVEREFPSFGAPFRALAYANVALNAIVGPIVFKLALDRAGESHAAPALTEGEEASA